MLAIIGFPMLLALGRIGFLLIAGAAAHCINPNAKER